MTWVEAWAHWRPFLREALDSRYYSIEWLECQVMSGRAVFWPADDCALVAEVRFYPTGARDVAVICAAGDPVKCRDTMVPALEALGRANGCLAIIVESREAWQRLLKPAGFEAYKVAVRKEI